MLICVNHSTETGQKKICISDSEVFNCTSRVIALSLKSPVALHLVICKVNIYVKFVYGMSMLHPRVTALIQYISTFRLMVNFQPG